MSQQPPQGPAGTPDEAARPDGSEPTEAFTHSPYDVPPTAGETEQLPVDAAQAPDYGQAPDPTRTIYSEASTTEPPPEPEAEPGRPRWVVPVVIAVILLLVAGGVVAAFFLGEDDEEPAPVTPTEQATEVTTPTETPTEEPTQEASPTEEPTEELTEEATPTEEPTPEASTELFDDLAETVSAGDGPRGAPAPPDPTYELTGDGFSADEDIIEQGALEAWRGQYASGNTEVDLLATLWADNDAADEFAAELTDGIDGEQIETGDTYTNETGTFWAFLLEDGRGSYVWTTDRGHVLQVVGSTDDVGGFYSNFPL